MDMKKRGISPVIATVLLIGLVVVIGLIVFFWFRGFIQEEGTKFGKNVKLVCEDVKFEADYSSGILSLSNIGNVPIYRINLRIIKEGGYETKSLSDVSSEWPDTGLNVGEIFSENIQSEVSEANKIIIVPVLIGSSGGGKKVYTCEEQYGYEINL